MSTWFNRKQDLEELQVVISKLHKQITAYEAQLETRANQIEHMQKELIDLQNMRNSQDKLIADKEAEIADLEARLVNYVHIEKYNQLIERLEKAEYIAKNRLHNERGAGRKPKATEEQGSYILKLYADGHNFNQIAKIMTEKTGSKWNRVTVRNIVIAKNNLFI